MSHEIKRFQCRHIHTSGHRCGSPSLRHENFCYYHHTTRKPAQNPKQRRVRQSEFDLPLPEDRSAIQLAIGQVLQRIATNQLDPKRAGLLLYGLQIASLNLPREAGNKARTQQEPTPVEELVEDPTHGPIAPEAELTQSRQKSVIQILLENLKGEEPETHHETRVPHPERTEGAKCGEAVNLTNLTEPASTTKYPLNSHTESDTSQTRTLADAGTGDPVPDTCKSPSNSTTSPQDQEHPTSYGTLTPGVINSTLSAPAACPASITPETAL